MAHAPRLPPLFLPHPPRWATLITLGRSRTCLPASMRSCHRGRSSQVSVGGRDLARPRGHGSWELWDHSGMEPQGVLVSGQWVWGGTRLWSVGLQV